MIVPIPGYSSSPVGRVPFQALLNFPGAGTCCRCAGRRRIFWAVSAAGSAGGVRRRGSFRLLPLTNWRGDPSRTLPGCGVRLRQAGNSCRARCPRSSHQLEFVPDYSSSRGDVGFLKALPNFPGHMRMWYGTGVGLPGRCRLGGAAGITRNQARSGRFYRLRARCFVPDLAGRPCNGCDGRVICAKRAVPQKRPFIEIGSGWAAFPEPTETLGAQNAPISRPTAAFRDWGRGCAPVSGPVVCPTVRPAPLSPSRKRACISDPGNSAVRHTLPLLATSRAPRTAASWAIAGFSAPGRAGPCSRPRTQPSGGVLGVFPSRRSAHFRSLEIYQTPHALCRQVPRAPQLPQVNRRAYEHQPCGFHGRLRGQLPDLRGTEPHVPLPHPCPPSLTSR